MNHTNELTAMLASGVSLHRVIMPMIVGAMLLNGVIIFNREVLVPANAAHLLRSRDEAGEVKRFPVSLAPDASGDIWWSPLYDPSTRTMESPMIAVRQDQVPLATVNALNGSATQAKLARPQGKPLKGWDLTDASITLTAKGEMVWRNTPSTSRVYTSFGPSRLVQLAKQRVAAAGKAVPPDSEITNVSNIGMAFDDAYGLTISTLCAPGKQSLQLGPYQQGASWGGTLIKPVFAFSVPVETEGGKQTQRMLGAFHASYATWVPGRGGASYWQLHDGKLFFQSDLTNEDLSLRQSSRWLDLMSLSTISQLLKRNKVPDREAAILAKHTRVANPINNLILLLLGLPFILSRERNIKASAGLSVLMTGAYFAFIHICRLVGLPPMLAAFLPIVLFGTVAAVMLDSIKT